MKRRSGGVAFALCTAALVLSITSWAWACTRQVVISISPKSGPAGTTIIVTGEGFNRLVPVEIRWKDVNGVKLGETTPQLNGTFSVEVKVPSAPPQIYDVIAEQSDSTQGTLRGTDRFTLVADAAQSQQVSSIDSGRTEPASDAQRGPSKDSQASNSTDGTGASEIERRPEIESANAAGRARGQAEPPRQAAQAGAVAPAAATAENPLTARGRSALPAEARTPASETVSQDLWSGFDARGGSLGGPAVEQPVPERNSPWIAGISLLAVGVAGVLSALVIAEVRLRRIRAET